jgi:hypothetical protein
MLLGKTTFLLYLLLYRLEHRLPTAIQFNPDFYLIFDRQGAAVLDPKSRPGRLRGCWALSDSNADIRHPCAAFSALALRVVLASPPEPTRWKEWLKQRGGDVVVSNLPLVLEIAAIL